MDKLTELISQARPLYKQRKRRRTIAKMLLSITVPVMLFANFANLYIQGDEVYMSMENSAMQNELLNDDFGMSEL